MSKQSCHAERKMNTNWSLYHVTKPWIFYGATDLIYILQLGNSFSTQNDVALSLKEPVKTQSG